MSSVVCDADESKRGSIHFNYLFYQSLVPNFQTLNDNELLLHCMSRTAELKDLWFAN